MHWITCHRDELQAVSGLAIVFLTIVLIILNTIYTRANWKVMRLMNADVRSRLKPIPQIGFVSGTAWNDPKGQHWILTVRAQNARMIPTGCFIYFALGTGPKQFEYFYNFNGNNIDSNGAQFEMRVKLPAPSNKWLLELHYKDLSGLLHYTTSFDENGFFSEGTPIDVHEWKNRMKFWWRRRVAKYRAWRDKSK